MGPLSGVPVGADGVQLGEQGTQRLGPTVPYLSPGSEAGRPVTSVTIRELPSSTDSSLFKHEPLRVCEPWASPGSGSSQILNRLLLDSVLHSITLSASYGLKSGSAKIKYRRSLYRVSNVGGELSVSSNI